MDDLTGFEKACCVGVHCVRACPANIKGPRCEFRRYCIAGVCTGHPYGCAAAYNKHRRHARHHLRFDLQVRKGHDSHACKTACVVTSQLPELEDAGVPNKLALGADDDPNKGEEFAPNGELAPKGEGADA